MQKRPFISSNMTITGLLQYLFIVEIRLLKHINILYIYKVWLNYYNVLYFIPIEIKIFHV